ncbi:hypothetical protein FEM48_Zijuj01G0023600 [Ziziphus jujuba var. spinosa]|uniref:SOSEKI DIX-like domain-containing protein n=1 Tax=Ziziphus jujuba var. spinosa TaxID=714518 RepID=A0A978VYK6_ZIZJJ|nr:hypothetical protein FEM48_Zijuj01G0023600 [Ziziphus jujuba var. spinosa]
MEAKAGGEVRRLHIIYFLSHMGRVDHPHLIRVHHLTHVKRWLADLRGKEMAEAYAWSYKRRYKTGYVWQDLLDDDLITPISDNEYVLKGSEIISATFDAPSNIQYVLENKAASPVHIEQQQAPITELVEEHKQLDQPKSSKQDFQTYPDSKIEIPTKTSSEINEESPHFGSDRSTLTDTESDESMKNIEDHSSSFSFNSNREMNKKMMKKKKKKNMDGRDQMEGTPASSHSSSSSSSSSSSTATTTTTSSKSAFTKSKSHSSGASYVFRNLMSCGAVDTNDTVLVMLNRRGGGDKSNETKRRNSSENIIFKGDKLGGSARVFGTYRHPQPSASSSSSRKSCDGEKDNSKKQQSQSQCESTNQKAVSAAYRPVREPICAQCGKPFKPEKMHSHMKSCRGMKALAKAAPTSLKKTPSHSNFNDSASAYLLTN